MEKYEFREDGERGKVNGSRFVVGTRRIWKEGEKVVGFSWISCRTQLSWSWYKHVHEYSGVNRVMKLKPIISILIRCIRRTQVIQVILLTVSTK